MRRERAQKWALFFCAEAIAPQVARIVLTQRGANVATASLCLSGTPVPWRVQLSFEGDDIIELADMRLILNA